MKSVKVREIELRNGLLRSAVIQQLHLSLPKLSEVQGSVRSLVMGLSTKIETLKTDKEGKPGYLKKKKRCHSELQGVVETWM